MYDMYPQAWALDEGQLSGVPERPRRRPRKAHSVAPAVIARQTSAADARSVLG